MTREHIHKSIISTSGGHEMKTKDQDFAFVFSSDLKEWFQSRQLRRNKAISEWTKADREMRAKRKGE